MFDGWRGTCQKQSLNPTNPTMKHVVSALWIQKVHFFFVPVSNQERGRVHPLTLSTISDLLALQSAPPRKIWRVWQADQGGGPRALRKQWEDQGRVSHKWGHDSLHIYIYVHIDTHTHTHIYIYIHIHIYVYTYTYMYIYIYICIYIYTHIHTHSIHYVIHSIFRVFCN